MPDAPKIAQTPRASGNGGEIDQSGGHRLTSNFRVPTSDNQNSWTSPARRRAPSGDPPMKGRQVAILIDEGSDMAATDTLKGEVDGAGVTVRHWDREPRAESSPDGAGAR